MYNGIGLQTPRGSGTSGYVQRNYSYVKQQFKNRDDFLKELKALKDNVIPAQKKANVDILEHEQKREVYVHLEKMREKLEKDGIDEDKIEEQLKNAETILLEKLKNKEFNTTNSKETHQQSLAKEKQQEKLRRAFKVKEDYKIGKAFDFDEQETKRQEKLYQKELEKKEKYELLLQERMKEKEQKKLQKKKEKHEQKLLLKQQKLEELKQQVKQGIKQQQEEEIKKSEQQNKIKNDEQLEKNLKQTKSQKKSRSISNSQDKDNKTKQKSSTLDKKQSKKDQKQKRKRSSSNSSISSDNNSESSDDDSSSSSSNKKSHKKIKKN